MITDFPLLIVQTLKYQLIKLVFKIVFRCFVWHQEDVFPKKMAVSLQPDQRLNQFHHAVAKTKSSVSR